VFTGACPQSLPVFTAREYEPLTRVVCASLCPPPLATALVVHTTQERFAECAQQYRHS